MLHGEQNHIQLRTATLQEEFIVHCTLPFFLHLNTEKRKSFIFPLNGKIKEFLFLEFKFFKNAQLYIKMC
jgi:hypothetical protein